MKKTGQYYEEINHAWRKLLCQGADDGVTAEEDFQDGAIMGTGGIFADRLLHAFNSSHHVSSHALQSTF